jgi:hypothetical protein
MMPVDMNLSPEDCEKAIKYLSTRYTVVGECHEWNLYKDKYGYGHLTMNDGERGYKAHRLSYAAHNGGILRGSNDIGERLVVRHLCDNKSCIRPEHLTIGSVADNADDHRRSGDMLIGSKHTNAKLNEDIVAEILVCLETMTRVQVAEKFGVARKTIGDIIHNKTWKHVPRRVPTTQTAFKKRVPIKDWTPELITAAYNAVVTYCEEADDPHPILGTPCLLWKDDAPVRDGRGRVPYKGVTYNAPKIACMYSEQRMCPPKWVTRHLCGNKRCCQPEHLKFGTSKENAIDRVRLREIKLKLNEDQVLDIRRRYSSGSITQKKLAEEYKVGERYIGHLINRKTWTHI